MFRKKSHAEVIGAELQEGLAHIGAAVSEARRATSEQLKPQVDAAVKAAQLAYATEVVPRVGAAAVALTPALEAARDPSHVLARCRSSSKSTSTAENREMSSGRNRTPACWTASSIPRSK